MDKIAWQCEVDVEKWDAHQTAWVQDKTGLERPDARYFIALGVEPYETIHIPAPANVVTTAGLANLATRLVTTAQVWDNTHVGMGVGISTTAEDAANTDLLGASKYYQVMDSGFPTASAAVLTFKSTFGSGVAEFAWNEYGILVPTTSTAFSAGTTKGGSYVLLNRKAPANLGTKPASSTWAAQATITLA